MLLKASLLSGILLTILSCMSPERLLSDESAERLYFGKSGGFTNIPMDYVVINYVQVFKIVNGTYEQVTRLSGRQSRQIKNLFNGLNFTQLSLNEPGNMTYYIRHSVSSGGKEIKWNDQTQNPEVKDLYKALISTVNP